MQAANNINIARLQHQKSVKPKKDDKKDDMSLSEVLEKNSADEKKFIGFWNGIFRGVEASNAVSRQYSFVNDVLKKKNNRERKATANFVFHPDHPLKLIWDLFLSFLVLYSVIIIPYNIGFQMAPTISQIKVDYMITAAFAADILVSFNTSYLNPNTERYVSNRPKIAINYLKFWFWADLVATIPFDELFAAVVSGNQLRAVRLIRVMRLLRLIKLYRIIQGDGMKQNSFISPGLAGLLTLIGQLFLIAHLFACFWHYLGVLNTIEQAYPTTWLKQFGFEKDTVGERYIASLYYIIVTMLTIGYGDIRATNQIERVFAIVTQLTGGIVFGALISKVTTLIDKRNPQAKAFKTHMEEFKVFLASTTLPSQMKRRAKAAYAYYLNKKSAFGESGILEELPPLLLQELVKELYHDDIVKVKMFQDYPASFVVSLVTHSRPFEAFPGEVIIYEGDVCNDLFFVKSGTVSIEPFKPVHDDHNILSQINVDIIQDDEVIDPLVFNEDMLNSDPTSHHAVGYVKDGGFFGDAEMLKNTTALALYRATNHCHLLAVKHSVVNSALADDNKTSIDFTNRVTERYASLMTVLGTKKKKKKESVPMQRDSMGMASGSAKARLERSNSIGRGLFRESRSASFSVPHFMKRTSGSMNFNNQGLLREIWIDGVIQLVNAKSIASKNEGVHGLIRVLEKGDQDNPVDRPISVLREKRLLHPTGRYKLVWDFFIGVIIVFSVLVVPVEIGFNEPAFRHSNAVSLVINCFFFLDIVASFFTAYTARSHDALIISRSMIAKNYLKTWFVIDFLSTVPFDQIFAAAMKDSANLSFTKLLKVIRLFRLLKMARVLKLSNYMETIEDTMKVPPAFFQLITLLFQVYFIAHLIACIFWGLAANFPINEETTSRWYEDDVGYFAAPVAQGSLIAKYLVSIYFTFTTITTVGYGDIYPQNVYERALGILIGLIGASIFGYTLANVSGAVNSLSSGNSAAKERVIEVIEYLNEKQCPKALAAKVVNHFYQKLDDSINDISKMTDRLPPILCNEMLAAVYQQRMQYIPIFKYIPCKSVAVYLFQLLQPSFLEANDYVVTEGKSAECLHFLVTGEAVVFKYKYKSFLMPSVNAANNNTGLDDSKHDKRGKLQRRVTIKAPQMEASTRSVRTSSSEESKSSIVPEGIRRRSSIKPNLTIYLPETHRSESNISILPEAPGTARGGLKSIFGEATDDLTDELGIELTATSTRGGNDYSPVNQDESRLPTETSGTPDYIPSNFTTPTPTTTPRTPRKSFLGSIAESTDAVRRGSMFTLSTYGTSKENADPLFAATEKSVAKMTAADFDKLQLKYLGVIGPGDFVGHGSYLQQRSTHICSVKTTMPSTVFLLPKVDILRLIRDEPSVGIQLQSALIQSIRGQKDWLGKLHRKMNRAHFLRDMRDDHSARLSKVGVQDVTRKRNMRQRNLVNFSRENSSKNIATPSIKRSSLPSMKLSSFSLSMSNISLMDTAAGQKSDWKKRSRLINLHKSKNLWYDSDDEKEKLTTIKLLTSSLHRHGSRKSTAPFTERALARLKRVKALKFFFGKSEEVKGPVKRSCSIADFEDFCARERLEKEKTLRVRGRRQTFPSIDVQYWKDRRVKEGVI